MEDAATGRDSGPDGSPAGDGDSGAGGMSTDAGAGGEDAGPDGSMLSPEEIAALDACEEVTGERKFEGCPVDVLCEALAADEVVPVELTYEPNLQTCEWGSSAEFSSDTDLSNLSQLNGSQQARFEQTQNIADHIEEREGEAVLICALDIQVRSLDPEEPDRFLYDDGLYLVFGGEDEQSAVEGGVVLATSYVGFIEPLVVDVPELPGVEWPLYRWRQLGDRGFSDQAGLFCLGHSEQELQQEPAPCAIPPTDTNGEFRLSFKDEVALGLGIRAALTRNYNLSVVTTGDNDEGDCEHQGFRATVNVGYVYVPEDVVDEIPPPIVI